MFAVLLPVTVRLTRVFRVCAVWKSTLQRYTPASDSLAGLALAVRGIAGSDTVPFLVAGVVLAYVGLGRAFARGTCSAGGVSYFSGRRRRVEAADITDVTVEPLGTGGSFPTLVVHRRSGRPLVLTGIQEWGTKAGAARQEALAEQWRRILSVPSAA